MNHRYVNFWVCILAFVLENKVVIVIELALLAVGVWLDNRSIRGSFWRKLESPWYKCKGFLKKRNKTGVWNKKGVRNSKYGNKYMNFLRFLSNNNWLWHYISGYLKVKSFNYFSNEEPLHYCDTLHRTSSQPNYISVERKAVTSTGSVLKLHNYWYKGGNFMSGCIL